MKGCLLEKKGSAVGLVIVRQGLPRWAGCPYVADVDCTCGPWCALFGEPETNPETGQTVIKTCSRDLVFREFDDFRRTKEDVTLIVEEDYTVRFDADGRQSRS